MNLQHVNFQAIFEAVPGNYLILKPDPPRFTIVAVSDAYARATLTKRENILNKGLFEVFPDNPDDPQASGVTNLTASLHEVVASKKMHKMPVQKYDIPNPDGYTFEEKYWSPLNTPVLNDAGEIEYIIHHVEDITERVKTSAALENQTEELRRTNAELEQFVRVSSHDLQEPLRKIRTFIGMVTAKYHERLDEFGIEQMQRISDSAEKMSKRLRDLLQYAYLRKESAFSPVDLGEVFKDVLDDLELVIREKEARFDVQPLPTIYAIRNQMHQLLFNLISNAIKFSHFHRSPEIKITVSEYYRDKDKMCEIVVSDNGIGFDQQHAERIFTVFERLQTGAIYAGTGIGLALCKKVVQNHRGDIFATGMQGKGASFHVLLPMPEYP